MKNSNKEKSENKIMIKNLKRFKENNLNQLKYENDFEHVSKDKEIPIQKRKKMEKEKINKNNKNLSFFKGKYFNSFNQNNFLIKSIFFLQLIIKICFGCFRMSWSKACFIQWRMCS